MNKELIISSNDIKSRIYTIRGQQVILDRDLATLYEVETRSLNQAVKRNIGRFPADFMLRLTRNEILNLSQIVISSKIKHAPNVNVFTEQGVAALSGVLKSSKSIEINIQIVRAFVAMRKFISKNAEIFVRLDRTERKLLEQDNKIEQVFNLIEEKDIKPEKGIFFDGQIFDAYKFVSDLVRSAKKSIILVDNYVDDSVLTLFSKRNENVIVKIFTKEISKQLKLDLARYNSQYPSVSVKEFKDSHDRFMIIDGNVYHFGASLKDLGKKWFAFSKFDKEAFGLLERLGN